MFNPKTEQARIAGNILSCYHNVNKLTIPIIDQVEFEKSVFNDKIPFILDEIMKSWSGEMITALEVEKDEVKKSELNSAITSEIGSLFKIDVVFDKVKKSVWVDIVDSEKKCFKDNSLTRKLNLVNGPLKA